LSREALNPGSSLHAEMNLQTPDTGPARYYGLPTRFHLHDRSVDLLNVVEDDRVILDCRKQTLQDVFVWFEREKRVLGMQDELVSRESVNQKDSRLKVRLYITVFKAK
jgi:hypothetical protein